MPRSSTKARALARVIPIDIRARHAIQRIHAQRGSDRLRAEDASHVFFREECKRLSGELVMLMRENMALRAHSEWLEQRVVYLEQTPFARPLCS